MKTQIFYPKHLAEMGRAFDTTIGITNLLIDPPSREVVARYIIGLASSGETDHAQMSDAALWWFFCRRVQTQAPSFRLAGRTLVWYATAQ